MVFVLAKQTVIISSYCSGILHFTFQYLAKVNFISTFLSPTSVSGQHRDFHCEAFATMTVNKIHPEYEV